MTRSHVRILFSGPLRPSLHTTPHTGIHQGQGLGNPLCYPRLPILYTLTRQHSELVFLPDSELRAQTVRYIQACELRFAVTRELNWWLLFLSTTVRVRNAFEGSPPPSRLVFVRIHPRQFCHKQQRPNSTLQLFNFCKPRSVLRALAGSVSLRKSLFETFLTMCRSTSGISL
jgi:hypothetical protein